VNLGQDVQLGKRKRSTCCSIRDELIASQRRRTGHARELAAVHALGAAADAARAAITDH
jgi:hypothetical protein